MHWSWNEKSLSRNIQNYELWMFKQLRICLTRAKPPCWLSLTGRRKREKQIGSQSVEGKCFFYEESFVFFAPKDVNISDFFLRGLKINNFWHLSMFLHLLRCFYVEEKKWFHCRLLPATGTKSFEIRRQKEKANFIMLSKARWWIGCS